jgi:hypothetical protein
VCARVLADPLRDGGRWQRAESRTGGKTEGGSTKEWVGAEREMMAKSLGPPNTDGSARSRLRNKRRLVPKVHEA